MSNTIFTDVQGAARRTGFSREHFVKKFVKTGLLRPLTSRSATARKHAKYIFLVRDVDALTPRPGEVEEK